MYRVRIPSSVLSDLPDLNIPEKHVRFAILQNAFRAARYRLGSHSYRIRKSRSNLGYAFCTSSCVHVHVTYCMRVITVKSVAMDSRVIYFKKFSKKKLSARIFHTADKCTYSRSQRINHSDNV